MWNGLLMVYYIEAEVEFHENGPTRQVIVLCNVYSIGHVKHLQTKVLENRTYCIHCAILHNLKQGSTAKMVLSIFHNDKVAVQQLKGDQILTLPANWQNPDKTSYLLSSYLISILDSCAHNCQRCVRLPRAHLYRLYFIFLQVL